MSDSEAADMQVWVVVYTKEEVTEDVCYNSFYKI
jgi:hypothetical protein